MDRKRDSFPYQPGKQKTLIWAGEKGDIQSDKMLAKVSNPQYGMAPEQLVVDGSC